MPIRNRVLVIDDNDAVRETFRRLLTAAKFDVVTVRSGEEGLEVLRRDPGIGLVLLDYDMPGMNGADVRRAQLADPDLALIPTVLVSGSSGSDFKKEDLQAEAYLDKPVPRDRLIEVVSRYCTPSGA
jgi:CheY-like chemotaxis protein